MSAQPSEERADIGDIAEARRGHIRSEGDELVFLISAPRSGSTLLQHMLGSHSSILTLPEPTFMLHLCYALRDGGWETEYDARLARLALEEFLERIPDGESVFIDAVRAMSIRLYEAALMPSGKERFLDKTPRYYLIIRELATIFPNAKFVLLMRNPLAIYSSILNTGINYTWTGFRDRDRWLDIVSAPKRLLEGTALLGDRAITVRYEDLVHDPESKLKEITAFLQVDYEPAMLRYGGQVDFAGSPFIDPKSIYRHEQAVSDYVDEWKARMSSEPYRTTALVYLDELGEETVDSLGYDYDELSASLASGRRQFVGPYVRLQRRAWRHLLRHGPPPVSWWRSRELDMFRLFRRGFTLRVSRRLGRALPSKRF
jgi:Sulfotransferase family